MVMSRLNTQQNKPKWLLPFQALALGVLAFSYLHWPDTPYWNFLLNSIAFVIALGCSVFQ